MTGSFESFPLSGVHRTGLRVLHIAPCFVDLTREGGGVANVVRQLALRQAAQGVDVTVYCGTVELGRVVASAGVKVSDGHLRTRAFAQYSFPAYGPVSELKKALDTSHGMFDIAHVHTCFSRFTESAMEVLAAQHVPFVFSPHGKLSMGMRANRTTTKAIWWRLLARRLVNRAESVFALSTAERHEVINAGIRVPVKIIPNGFDRPTSEIQESPIHTPFILFLGYLDPRKQPGFLIKAFAASRARHTYTLALVGPDKYNHAAELQLIAKRLDVGTRVIFPGAAFAGKKWGFLNNATCICLPSLAEGLPIVLCEALGAGVPAIYSEACNFGEIAAAGAGLEMKGFDHRAWADAIDSITGDAEYRTRLAENALDLAKHYTWESIVTRTLDSYGEILGELKSSAA